MHAARLLVLKLNLLHRTSAGITIIDYHSDHQATADMFERVEAHTIL